MTEQFEGTPARRLSDYETVDQPVTETRQTNVHDLEKAAESNGYFISYGEKDNGSSGLVHSKIIDGVLVYAEGKYKGQPINKLPSS